MTDLLTITHEITQDGTERAEVLQAFAAAALADEMRTANLLALAETLYNRFGGMIVLGYQRSLRADAIVSEVTRRIGGTLIVQAADDEDE